MDNSVGATLCSRRQRSLSAIFEHVDSKWYASGEAESACPISRDIYDTQRFRDTLLDEDENSLFDNLFDHSLQFQSQDQSPKRKQKKCKFSYNRTALTDECCDTTTSSEILSVADLMRGNVDATKLRLGYRSTDNEDTAKMSPSAIEHAPCLFPISEAKTEESSFEENPISSPGLASEEEGNLLIGLCKQSLTGAAELLLDTFQGDSKTTSITSGATETHCNADENEGDLQCEHCNADENEGDLQKYIAIAETLVLSTLTYRERALHRYHYKRKRRMFLRRNKRKSKFARLRSRAKGRFTSIHSKCRPNKT